MPFPHDFSYAYHKYVNYDHPGECSPEKDCSSKSVKVTTNSPSQDYTHPDDHNLRTYDMTPGFKPFTSLCLCYSYFKLEFLIPQNLRRRI